MRMTGMKAKCNANSIFLFTRRLASQCAAALSDQYLRQLLRYSVDLCGQCSTFRAQYVSISAKSQNGTKSPTYTRGSGD